MAVLASAELTFCCVQDTLRAARQGLAERDFLVAAHEHSEAALAGAAAALRAELAGTAGELTAVFAKVDELSGVAAANGAVVRGLRSDAAARLQVLLPLQHRYPWLVATAQPLR